MANTSLTDAQLRKFTNESEIGKTLFCKKIKGFHVIKLKNKVTYRLRYLDSLSKTRVISIGNYPAFKPSNAADKALDVIANDKDPLKEKADKRKQAHSDLELAKHRSLRGYLNGLYARHQADKKSGDATLKMIRHNFEQWLDRDMTTITAAEIRQWQLEREKEIRYPTILRAYGALKTMLNKAVADEVISENPLPLKTPLKKPSHAETEERYQNTGERSVMEQGELERLFSGLETLGREHWFYPFCYLAYFTGLRTGDLFGLTWAELNLKFKKLVKVPEKTRHHSDPITVTLALPDQLIAIMTEWHIKQGKPQSGLVFPSPVTGKRMDKKAHTKAWTKVKKFGGLSPTLNFYTLRHHWISTLIMSGKPIFTVARMAGHKSTKMIEQTYGHLAPSHTQDALDVFAITGKQENKKEVV